MIPKVRDEADAASLKAQPAQGQPARCRLLALRHNSAAIALPADHPCRPLARQAVNMALACTPGIAHDAGGGPMLIDSIYEAAVLPQKWSDVLDSISSRFAARGGMLIRASATAQNSICSPAIEETVRLFEQSPLVTQNVRVERLAAHPPHPGFLTDLDLVTLEEIETLPIYTDWLTPHGSAVGAATLIQDAGDTRLLMSLEGLPDHDAARRAIPDLDALRPHIARATMLSSRFQFERMRSAVDALAAIGSAAALIDDRGRVQASNALFDRQLSSMIGKGGLVRLPSPRLQAQFDHGLARLSFAGASIALHRPIDGAFRILHMVPVRGDARDIFTETAAFLVVVDPARRTAPGTGLLQSLFDLTPAEARIADRLAHGLALGTIAREAGISPETARKQLAAIFLKTGVNRQSDLIAMLGQVVRPSAGEDAGD